MKINYYKKIGIINSLIAIPVWIMNYFITILLSLIVEGKINANIKLINFTLIPIILATASIAVAFFNLNKKLNIHSRYVTVLFVYLHAAWAHINYVYFLPEQYNAFSLFFNFMAAVLYIGPFVGFWGVILLVVYNALFLVLVPLSGYSFGFDDYFLMIFYVFMAIGGSLSSRFTFKLRQIAKEAHVKAELQKEEIERLAKQTIHFFQNISHELRTPLTLILNPLEDLLGKYKDDSIELISKNANRLYRLVNQLLDFQKVSQSKQEMELIPVDLASFLKTCAEYFKPSCDIKKIRFSLNINTQKNIFILAEIDSLEKIIFNYLSNALKFTKGGFISIDLEEEDGYALISVSDSGVGIKDKDKDKLFKVFSQVDGNSSREFEGTGLGLALVKELAVKMNGEVGVEDGHGGFGSKFWVRFKIASNRDLNVLDVLFIDDDDEQVMLFQKFMDRELPYMNYKAVDSTEKAREILKNNNVKCLLSDAVMDGENGVSFLTWISQEHPKATKVLVTGRADTDILEKAINESQIDHIIKKPWQGDNFKEKIENFVKTSKLKISTPADLKKFTPKDWLLERELHDKVLDSTLEEESVEGSGELILVVDDLKDMRVLISRTLKNHGFKLFTAVNGEDAIEKIKEKKPDIIVTDWMMPKMSGVELINKLKSDKVLSAIPAILLTAKSDEESKGVGIELGADGFIGKPFSEMELISVVKNNLRLKKREKELEVLNQNISQNILKRYIPNEKLTELQSGKDIFSEKTKPQHLPILTFDITEFSRTLDDLGLKNAADLLDDYLDLSSQIISKNSGIISKVGVSEIVSIFGYNSALSEKDKLNLAIKALEKFFKSVEGLNNKYKLKENEKITLRSALNFGTIQVGFFGGTNKTTFMAIGKPVDKAINLKNSLKPNEILYTKEVLFNLENEKWEKAKKVKLEGFSENETFFLLSKE
jgi:signal transduction histidine kinase/DNA-binding response OmpR family regulator